MIYIINHIILALFNILNSQWDAYRILKHKSIAHALNFGAYATLVGAIIWLQDYPWQCEIVFVISAFFQRQLVFDTFLNLRRGKAWDYMSTANPPKAIMDRIERKIFGYDGKAAFFTYLKCFVLCTFIYYII